MEGRGMKHTLIIDVVSYEGNEAILSSLKKLREEGKIGITHSVLIKESKREIIEREYKQTL